MNIYMAIWIFEYFGWGKVKVKLKILGTMFHLTVGLHILKSQQISLQTENECTKETSLEFSNLSFGIAPVLHMH